MHLQLRGLLFLVLGLAAAAAAAAASAYAQGAGAVVRDATGTLAIQIGTNPPQPYKPGTAIPAGAIVRTGAKSAVTLVFPDGNICVLGENSTLRMANSAYDPSDPTKGAMVVNLIDGSLRVVTSDMARGNPSALRVQAGTATLGVGAGTDASIVVQNGQAAMTVNRGNIQALSSSCPPQSVGPGQGLLPSQDCAAARGTAPQVVQRLGPQGQQQFAALGAAGPGIELTLVALANPVTRQALFAPLEGLPAAGNEAFPPLQANSGNTPVTGAGGGGRPCTASCN